MDKLTIATQNKRRGHAMLQMNPEIALLRANLRTAAPTLWCVLFAFSAVAILSRSYQAQTFVFSPILLIPFLTLTSIHGKALFDVCWQSRPSYVQRQERVLVGDTSLLAVEQPIPNTHLLPSYIFISWRTRVSACLLVYLLIWLVMLALIMPFLVFLLPASQVIDFLPTLGVAFASIPALVAFFVLWEKRRFS